MTGAAASPCCEASSKSLAGWRKAAACISTAGPARPGWFVYPPSHPVQCWVGSGCPLLCLGQLVEAEPYLASWGAPIRLLLLDCSQLCLSLVLKAAVADQSQLTHPSSATSTRSTSPAHRPLERLKQQQQKNSRERIC